MERFWRQVCFQRAVWKRDRLSEESALVKYDRMERNRVMLRRVYSSLSRLDDTWHHITQGEDARLPNGVSAVYECSR